MIIHCWYWSLEFWFLFHAAQLRWWHLSNVDVIFNLTFVLAMLPNLENNGAEEISNPLPPPLHGLNAAFCFNFKPISRHSAVSRLILFEIWMGRSQRFGGAVGLMADRLSTRRGCHCWRWKSLQSQISPRFVSRAPSQYKDRLIYVWRFPC